MFLYLYDPLRLDNGIRAKISRQLPSIRNLPMGWWYVLTGQEEDKMSSPGNKEGISWTGWLPWSTAEWRMGLIN